MQTLDCSFELKSTPKNDGTFEGYASTFGNTDATGDVVLPGAFARSIREKGPRGVALLWQHGRESLDPVGEWLELREDSKGLFVKGQLFMDLARAKDRLLLLRRKAVDALSFGFSVPPGGAEYDVKTGIRKLKEVALFEISPVTFGANPRATITGAKHSQRITDLDEVRRELVQEGARKAERVSASLTTVSSAVGEVRAILARAELARWRGMG